MKTINLKKLINSNFLKVLFIILIISVFAAPPFVIKQIYIAEDVLYHILRINELSKNILNGHIFPYIHTGALDGYGYGGAFFYPEFTLTIPALFYIAGFDIVDSINISIVIYNVVAGILSYLCLTVFLKDVLKKDDSITWISLIGAIAYIVYPYRLYNIFYRGAINEFIAMSFTPLSLLAMYKIFFKKEFEYWKMLSASFSLMLLTHLGTTLMLGIVGVIFFILNIKLIADKKFIKNMLKAILCAVLATSYFLFPMIEQMLSNEFRYTTLPKLNDETLYELKTIDKQALSIVGDSLNQPILILGNVLLILLLVYVYKKLSDKLKSNRWSIIIGSTLLFVYVFVMQTDIFPWVSIKEIFPLIQQIQFPFRFFTLLGLAFSLIIALSAPTLIAEDKYIKCIIILFVMISPSLTISDKDLKRYSYNADEVNKINVSCNLGFAEYLPSKIKHEYKDYIQERGNVIKIRYKDGTEEDVKRNFNESHTEYSINNSKGDIESIELPLVYYKGYDIKNNKNKIEIKESSNGFIEVKNIPKSIVDIEVYYKGTFTQVISNFVSVISLCSMILFNKIYKRKEMCRCSKN